MKLPTIKRLTTSSDETYMFRVVGVAAVIVVFSLASTKVLLSQATYKRHIINARHNAVNALEQDLSRSDALKSQYQVFEGNNPVNIIGGRNTSDSGANPPDGDNSRIVLDALPSSYDFPALISSVSKILTNDGVNNPSIGGTDQSETIKSTATPKPQPIAIPLTISGSNTYTGIQILIRDLERSIRPFDISALNIQGTESTMSFGLTMNTYFQPAKTLNITDKAIQ